MLRIRRRVKTSHVDFSMGRTHPVRGTLGTKNQQAAGHLICRLDIALAEGPRSKLWAELRPVVPYGTFTRFAKYAGVADKLVLTWKDFRGLFESHRRQLFELDKLSV